MGTGVAAPARGVAWVRAYASPHHPSGAGATCSYTASGSKRASSTGVEIELRDARSGLSGRADRIEQDGRATRVVDLKTGLHQAEPTPAQRRQLLLYAILVQRTTGQWPSSIAVEDASGNRYDQPLDPDEAETA